MAPGPASFLCVQPSTTPFYPMDPATERHPHPYRGYFEEDVTHPLPSVNPGI